MKDVPVRVLTDFGGKSPAHPDHAKIRWNLTWLVVIPAILWGAVNLFIPIFGGGLSQVETWAMAVLIGLLIGASVIGHSMAHGFAARLAGSEVTSSFSLLIFGDAAQAWPASDTPWVETLSALAGPLFNLVIAGLAYLLWNAQWNIFLNISMLFLCGFNLWLVAINLIPAFPLDGGRLVRSIGWGLLEQPAAAGWAFVAGYLIAAALIGWGLYLIAQRARFSLETGLATFLLAMLIFIGLRHQPAWKEDRSIQDVRSRSLIHRSIKALIAALLILTMSGIASSLLLTNDGLEAPGFALPVEPMVEVPSQYRHTHPGSFILTSVITQAPIVAGEWLAGKISPVVKIVPPETIVPKNTTPQEVARQGYQMLDTSETTAVVVGLRLAGYPVQMIGKGVVVVSVLAISLAQGLLQPGDVITGLDGKPIRLVSELIDQIKAQSPQATVHLTVIRDQQQMEIAVPLMPSAAPGGSPKLGITIDQAGFDTNLPFPVKITSQKIVGGPSAGLMFTLTVANTLFPADLTGGRKIAGTGTINPDGSVGPIGGVEQKVAAAEAAGAEYFLSPVENYQDALSVARHIKVISVATAGQAVEFLRNLPPTQP